LQLLLFTPSLRSLISFTDAHSQGDDHQAMKVRVRSINFDAPENPDHITVKNHAWIGSEKMVGCGERAVLVLKRYRRCQAGGCSRHWVHRADVRVPALRRMGRKKDPLLCAGGSF